MYIIYISCLDQFGIKTTSLYLFLTLCPSVSLSISLYYLMRVRVVMRKRQPLTIMSRNTGRCRYQPCNMYTA